jgi:hypothetical protein
MSDFFDVVPFAELPGGGGKLVVFAEVTDGAKTEEVFGWVDML